MRCPCRQPVRPRASLASANWGAAALPRQYRRVVEGSATLPAGFYVYPGAFYFAPFRDVAENLAARRQDSVILGVGLPTTNDAVNVFRIKPDEIAPASSLWAAISVDPLPPKGSRTMPLRPETSLIASAIIATGFTVGCRESSSSGRS